MVDLLHGSSEQTDFINSLRWVDTGELIYLVATAFGKLKQLGYLHADDSPCECGDEDCENNKPMHGFHYLARAEDEDFELVTICSDKDVLRRQVELMARVGLLPAVDACEEALLASVRRTN